MPWRFEKAFPESDSGNFVSRVKVLSLREGNFVAAGRFPSVP
jgi:hypothetical protein